MFLFKKLFGASSPVATVQAL